MAEGVQPEQKRDIIDFYTRIDEPERTRAERPTACIYIYIYTHYYNLAIQLIITLFIALF